MPFWIGRKAHQNSKVSGHMCSKKLSKFQQTLLHLQIQNTPHECNSRKGRKLNFQFLLQRTKQHRSDFKRNFLFLQKVKFMIFQRMSQKSIEDIIVFYVQCLRQLFQQDSCVYIWLFSCYFMLKYPKLPIPLCSPQLILRSNRLVLLLTTGNEKPTINVKQNIG